MAVSHNFIAFEIYQFLLYSTEIDIDEHDSESEIFEFELEFEFERSSHMSLQKYTMSETLLRLLSKFNTLYGVV